MNNPKPQAKNQRRNRRLSASACSASCGDSMNDQFRNGGNIVEDREDGRDSISAMRLAHQRPDVLANALLEMGITENGDEVPDDE